MFLKCIFFILLYFVNLINAQNLLQTNQSCTTSTGQQGTCIFLTECSIIYNMIVSSKGNLSVDDTLNIRYSWCAIENRKHKICCPSNITPQQENGQIIEHPNIQLLPQSNCGAFVENRIIGNSMTYPFDNPWIALIELEANGNNYSCAGSIINKRYILTAAHCLHERVVVSVVLGEHDKLTNIDCDDTNECAEPAKRFNVEKITSHPDFILNKLINDVALVRLTKDINFSDSIQPICLPIDETQINFTFNYVRVTGWKQSVNILLQTSLKVVSNDECSRIYPPSINVTKIHMCANKQEGGQPVCIGDSGGPVFSPALVINEKRYRMFQFGIISAGYEFCNILPGLYTKVAPYITWILNTIHE